MRAGLPQAARQSRCLAPVAQLQFAAHDIKNAVKSLERPIRLQPGNTAAWFNMGVAALKLGRIQRGMECLKRVIEIDPRRTDAVLALAEIHKNRKDYESAMHVLHAGLDASPADVRLNWLLGLCLQDTGRLAEGMRYFGRTSRLMRGIPQGTPADSRVPVSNTAA